MLNPQKFLKFENPLARLARRETRISVMYGRRCRRFQVRKKKFWRRSSDVSTHSAEDSKFVKNNNPGTAHQM